MFEGLKVVVGLISFIMVYRTITGNCNKYLAFAICAIWLRFFLSAFHTITYPSLVAGFSINALGSISVVCFGFLLIPTFIFSLKKYFSVFVFLACIIVSGVINVKIPGTINALVKWLYFLVLASALILSIRAQGQNNTLKKLLVAFSMPVILQLLSIALGHVKAAEADGSTSYIGGYNHEAAFSMIIVSFILIVGLLDRGTIRFKTTLFSVSLLLLILVNYRTSILTILPIAAIFYYTLIEQRLKQNQKAPVMFLVILLLLLLFIILSFSMKERFADVAVLFSNLELIIKAPIYFSEAEQDIMSARVYIWSRYIDAFRHADLLNQLVGFGAGAWNSRFDLYAHNTFVSYLYEYGVLGVSGFLFLCINVFVNAFKLQHKRLSRVLVLSFFGFLAMNMATMPLWNIEGLIFFAILNSVIIGQKSSAPLNTMETKQDVM